MRYAAIISLSTLCLALTACSSSPEAKVKQAEQGKAALKESSGYNACMDLVKKELAAHDDCIWAKVAAKGFTDRTDCILNPNDAICDTPRYNAQVNANNDCISERTPLTDMTFLDCDKMLSDAQ